MRRRILMAVAVFVVTALVAVPQSSARQTTDPSGLYLAGPRGATQPAREPLAKAWSDALWLARDNPDDFGYPWADIAGDRVVVSVVGGNAQSILGGWLAGTARTLGPKGISLPRPQVGILLRNTTLSLRRLEQMKSDVSGLTKAGVPDASEIYMAEPDFEHNRVLITVEHRSDALFNALVARFGADAVTVRVDPDRPTIRAISRDDDSPPFFGGGKIQSPNGPCTTSFAWREATGAYEMLTAAHCAYNGGNVYNGNSSYYMGAVTASYEENWTSGTGTVFYTGQSVYRGDVALIRVSSSYGTGSAATMWRGLYTTAPVKEKWYRSPMNNDQFCTAGYASGELCGWTVDAVGALINDGGGNYWRYVTRGYRSGSGLQPGDSGGPAYTVRGDGGIAAKGTIGAAGWNFSYQFAYFTDIWDSYYGLPGDLMIQ